MTLVGIRGKMSISNIFDADDTDSRKALEHIEMMSYIATAIAESECGLADEVDPIEAVLSSAEKINNIARVVHVNDLQERIDEDLQRK